MPRDAGHFVFRGLLKCERASWFFYRTLCHIMSYSVVWFKRDLRVHDHALFALAPKRGPVFCLYIL